MKNKTCNNCNSINGERATYCRKCGVSLEDAVVTQVGVRKRPEDVPNRTADKAPVQRPGRRPTSTPAVAPAAPKSRALPQASGEQITLPKRPSKPAVIYWPFVLSIVSALSMLALIVAFVLLSGGSDEPTAGTSPVSTSAVTSASSSAAAEGSETSSANATDLSEIIIGDIADQTYTGDYVTIPFSLTHNDHVLEEGVDYVITYEDNVAPGTATVYFEGIGDDFTGSFDTSFNIVTGDEVVDNPDNYLVVIFSMRLSWTMLGRSPSTEELIDQVHRLIDHDVTGAELVNEISFSDESVNRNLTNEEFVSAFYQGVLARPADEEGLAYNVSLLEDGMSREDWASAIVNAEDGEFASICNSVGVIPY